MTLILPTRKILTWGGASRDFIASSSQYLQSSGVVVDSLPLTMACWFRPNTDTAREALMRVGVAATGDGWYTQYNATIANNPVRAFATAGGSTLGFASLDTGSGLAGEWHLLTGRFFANNQRYVSLDTNHSAINSDNVVPASGPYVVQVAARYYTSLGDYFDGSISHPAVWDCALTRDEIARLYNSGFGIDPRLIRPNNCVAYYPLFNNDLNYAYTGRQYDLTPFSGPTFVPGGPIIRQKTITYFPVSDQPQPPGDMEGAGASYSDGEGILVAVVNLDGSGTSTSSGSGTLTDAGGPTDIAGTGTSTSSGVGTLAQIRPIAGTGTSTSSGVGTLSDAGGPTNIVGIGLSISSGEGTLIGEAPLLGEGTSISSGIGFLQGPGTMLGIGTSYSSGLGVLVDAIVSITAPGIEVTWPVNRMHFTLPRNKTHITMLED